MKNQESPGTSELKERILTQLDLSEEVDDEKVKDLIHGVLKEHSKFGYLDLGQRCVLGQKLFYDIRRPGILQPFLEDPEITEIMINGSQQGVFVERRGILEFVPNTSITKEKLEELVIKITGMSNRMINEASPLADARLEDGSRVHLAIPPVAVNGPIITIRRFPKTPFRCKDLLKNHSFNEEIAEFLSLVVKAKYNIFVSGSTGSGKTTLLNVLSEFISPPGKNYYN